MPARGDPGGANPTLCPTAGLPTAGTVPEEGIPILVHPGWGAGMAIATWLCTAPSSPQHLLPHTAPQPLLAPHQKQPGCPCLGNWVAGPMAASVSPCTVLQWDHGAGDPSTHWTLLTAPGHGCATPAAVPRLLCGGTALPHNHGVRRHSAAPNAMVGGGSGVAGACPSAVAGTQAGKHLPEP